MKRIRNLMSPARRKEDGVEAVAMIIVLPTMFVLLLALIDVGLQIRTRMIVENMARDTVRRVAADGGNNWERTNPNGMPWDATMKRRLYSEGQCTESGCTAPPEVACNLVTPAFGGSRYEDNVVNVAGDLVTCRVVYHYKAINKNLLDSPLGLFTGRLIQDTITIEVSARAETGPNG